MKSSFFLFSDFTLSNFPRLNASKFRPPKFSQAKLPDIPVVDVMNEGSNRLSKLVDGSRSAFEDLQNSTKYNNYTYDPDVEFKPQFDFLTADVFVIILTIMDVLWFIYRHSKTYNTVVQLLHGFDYVIETQDTGEFG